MLFVRSTSMINASVLADHTDFRTIWTSLSYITWNSTIIGFIENTVATTIAVASTH